ncbi:hypothetical protein ADUPG1_000145 [Aduncisulcus paluster]|uniref:Uncharacterized protein n=1 Tax=Aduncisulcus paluster TaxID=2918883 RepID=A0ABQ5K8D3_9EUKA|nr:hypothetical protein ADUPG1_000145 [Aduncisulcus paluster]
MGDKDDQDLAMKFVEFGALGGECADIAGMALNILQKQREAGEDLGMDTYSGADIFGEDARLEALQKEDEALSRELDTVDRNLRILTDKIQEYKLSIAEKKAHNLEQENINAKVKRELKKIAEKRSKDSEKQAELLHMRSVAAKRLIEANDQIRMYAKRAAESLKQRDQAKYQFEMSKKECIRLESLKTERKKELIDMKSYFDGVIGKNRKLVRDIKAEIERKESHLRPLKMKLGQLMKFVEEGKLPWLEEDEKEEGKEEDK